MQILIISGFLGAGKTTFIKELIKRTDKNPVIMENEYGANNLDSLELQDSAKDSDEVKVLEFMEGCVCCTMKDSFVNSVLAIYSSLCPEYLIIEPTGVGKLSSIIENLKPILNTVIFMLEPVVILSPLTFRQNMKQWPDLYTDQIANAGKIVFSKCENSSAEELKDIADQIRKINPSATIVSEHYTKMDDRFWNSLMEAGDEKIKEQDSYLRHSADMSKENNKSEGIQPSADMTNENNSSEGIPQTDTINISQVSISCAGLHNPAQLVMLLEDCLRGSYGLISRAKGTLWVGGEYLRFDLADRMYAITDTSADNCQCVFIGKNLDEKKLNTYLSGGRRKIKL
ncbi:GTP-binding protein [Butyrivibrio fibrisolvens]|uniref:GTP-binding protein n=1 Tax=Butyrivibrio fibrisolvens TaxID=831 RepID=UPI0003B600E6|nr:GTP-binding protein [Butyrivibrio fibrisolvens]